jgi:hypothetical protein
VRHDLESGLDRGRDRRASDPPYAEGGFDDHPGRIDEGQSPVLQIAGILARAHLRCAVSGLRFGFRTTKRIVEGQARLLEHLRAGRSGNDRLEQAVRTIVDESRGCLRELAEASSQEFRRLQSELAHLDQEARTLIEQAADSRNGYVRRWKVKQ